MKAKVFMYIGAVLIIVGLFFYLSPYTTSTKTEDYDVHRGIMLELTWPDLEKGERIAGYFTIRGGNEEVEFYIKDPYGAIIHDAGTVKSRHDFAFTAEHSGVYSLYFENYAGTSDKQIFVTYETKFKSIFHDLSLPIVLLGTLILIAGLLSFYEKRLKERKKATLSVRTEQPTKGEQAARVAIKF